MHADLVLVATGRTSNADQLDPDLAGVELDDGLVNVDEYQRATAARHFRAR